MSEFLICAAVRAMVKPFVEKVLKKQLPTIPVSNLVFGDNAAAFQEAKASGLKIYLIVETAIGYDAIKFLCDDLHAPLQERRVQLVYSMSSGMDTYRLNELAAELENIPIHNGKDVYSDILGEHVVFAMMYFNRSPWRLNASKAARHWDRFNMTEVRGQKVGIFGYGSIGAAAGVRAKALGMEVTGVRRSVPAGGVDAHGVRVVSDAETDRVLAESDFVVGVLPGTPATKQFFNKDVFAKMKPSAVFINIGRGVTQSEADLVEALNGNVIRAAALDVFEVEPLPAESPLWDLPDDKLLLSAHCADWTEGLITLSAARFSEIFEQYVKDGKSDAHCVDAAKGY